MFNKKTMCRTRRHDSFSRDPLLLRVQGLEDEGGRVPLHKRASTPKPVRSVAHPESIHRTKLSSRIWSPPQESALETFSANTTVGGRAGGVMMVEVVLLVALVMVVVAAKVLLIMVLDHISRGGDGVVCRVGDSSRGGDGDTVGCGSRVVVVVVVWLAVVVVVGLFLLMVAWWW